MRAYDESGKPFESKKVPRSDAEDAPRARVVVPQRGRADLTCSCLESIGEHEEIPFETVVVDDGSADDSRAAVASRRFPRTQVVAQQRRGVTAAWNRGAGRSTAPYLVFLNNDTLCRGPLIAGLIEPLRTGQALVSGVLSREERHLPPDVVDRLPSHRFLQGWCFAVRRADFEEAGGFDESLRLYFSDTDLQCRLLESHKAGPERLVAVPELPIVHLAHRTARELDDRRLLWRADRRAFLQKWKRR